MVKYLKKIKEDYDYLPNDTKVSVWWFMVIVAALMYTIYCFADFLLS